MQNAEWLKIKEVFNQTLDLPESERDEFLSSFNESTCVEVSRLLESYEKLDDFIAKPIALEIGLGGNSYVGKTIGSYKLFSLLGAGGMGHVFLAEKEGFDKKFALKLIKRGMDTEAVLQHFVRERQILSRLEHPNIAQILDVGSTDDGLPYFVMEYVEGKTLTKFCDTHQLDTKERLEIFQKICEAVKYAHQNLIIHRDIKPSNIIVTEDRTPKLLDFGVAKLLSSEKEDKTTTAFQSRMFTPEYASPEQINGLPMTTATDVYSLGVVLYELLSGVRPFNSTGKNYQEIANLVLTQEPIRPSSVVSRPLAVDEKGTSENKEPRTTDEGPRTKSLKGDLDNIILKSLRKEPERRYQSVQEFSEDIRRYLVGLPVTATADTAFYRFSKFVGRHKVGAAVACLILALSGFALWQSITANRERTRAEQRFEQVRKLANLVLFEYHDGIASLPGATAMREKMVKDSLEFLDNLSAENIDNVNLQRDIVKAYRKVGDIQGASDTSNIGKTNESLQSFQKALAMQEKIVSANPTNVEDKLMIGKINLDIGLQQRNIGDLSGVEKSLQNALNIFSNLPNELKTQSSLAKTFWNIASLQTAQNNLDGSLENYGKAVEIYQQLAIAEPTNPYHLRNVALTNKNIGSVLQLLGQKEKALSHFQKSLAIDSENAKNNPNDVSAQLDLSFTYGTIASVLRDVNDFQGSLENSRKAIEIRENIFNADNKNAFAENALARGYQELGRTCLATQKFAEAEQNVSKAQIFYQKMADSDAGNLVKKANLADNLALLGYVHGLNQNLIEANEFYQKSIAIFADLMKRERLSTLDQRRFAATYLGFAEVLLKNRHKAKAQENLTKAANLLADEKVKKDAGEQLEILEKLTAQAKEK